VEFVLEVRDESTMSPPLISRCRRFVLPPLSHRKRGFLETIEKRGYADLRKVYTANIQRGACWSPGVGSNLTHSIVQAKASGLDPEQLINNVLKTTPLELQLETYKKLGEGVSPWILLAHVCFRSAVAA
jgi:DNA polymerase III delta prime subunit